eukprot:g48859.t1
MQHKRYDCAAAVLNGAIYVLGGRELGSNSVERFQPVASSFSSFSSFSSSSPSFAASPSSSSAATHAPPEAGKKWELMPPMLLERRGCAAAVLDGMLYAIGGSTIGVPFESSVERFDPKYNKWELVAPMLYPRVLCAAAVLEDHLYVTGGQGARGTLSAVERYDPKKNAWEVVECAMTMPRFLHAAVTLT